MRRIHNHLFRRLPDVLLVTAGMSLSACAVSTPNDTRPGEHTGSATAASVTIGPFGPIESGLTIPSPIMSVGQMMIAFPDALPPGAGFVSYSWGRTDPARTYGDYLQAASFGRLYPVAPPSAPYTSPTRWVWTHPGPQTVTATRTIALEGYPAPIVIEDTATVQVTAPPIAQVTITPGTVTRSTFKEGTLGCFLDFGGPGAPGINMDAAVISNTWNPAGRLRWVQLVRINRVTTEGGSRHENVHDWALDARPGKVDYTKNDDGVALPGGGQTAAPEPLQDSPGAILEHGQDFTVHDQYRTYLMWKPDGAGSIYVPIYRVDWSWGATITNDDGQCELSGVHVPAAQVVPADLPEWTESAEPYMFEDEVPPPPTTPPTTPPPPPPDSPPPPPPPIAPLDSQVLNSAMCHPAPSAVLGTCNEGFCNNGLGCAWLRKNPDLARDPATTGCVPASCFPYGIPRGVELDFGGAFGNVSDGNGAAERAVPNPATGAPSCPDGYLPQQVYGTNGTDWSATFCFRAHEPSDQDIFDFGGVWGYVGGNLSPNLITNQASCPDGYTDQRVLGTYGTDYDLHVCYRKPHSGKKMRFGGFIGTVDGQAGTNPATGAATCPEGFQRHEVLGTSNVDWPLAVCEEPTDVQWNFQWAGSSPCYSGFPAATSAAVREPDECPEGYSETDYGQTAAHCPNFACECSDWASCAQASEFAWGCPASYPWLPLKVRQCEKN